MNKKRFRDVRVLTASMPASMVEAIESACNARGISRSAWIRDILTPILEGAHYDARCGVDTALWGADEAQEMLGVYDEEPENE